jgi:flagellin-like hook-associated protein FlgL
MLGLTQSTQAKSTEKLSSGYKINRAADDAAGLSISEKMRKQMRGLTQASANAQDGISAVQTAEGALTEVHDMLQRMNELATKAANGTNSESDRTAIQNEIDQLTTEIDRVSETTKFNEMYLLKGNVEGTKSEMKLSAHDAGITGKLEDLNNGKTTFTMDKLKDGDTVTIAGKAYNIAATGSSAAGGLMRPGDMNKSVDGYAAASTLTGKVLDATKGDSVTFGGKTYTATDKFGLDDIDWAHTATDGTAKFKIGETEYQISTATSIHKPDSEDPTGTYKVTREDALALMQQAIDAGEQVTASANMKSKFSANGQTASSGADINNNTQFVSSLADGEVTTALDTAANFTALVAVKQGTGNNDIAAANFTAGDSVTKYGDTPKTTVGTAYTPTAAKTVYDSLKGATAGKTVTIGDQDNATKWTVVANDYEIDEGSFKDTIKNILARIQDGDKVASDVTGFTTCTVVGDIGTGSASKNADTITADAAYKMIADELQKASSIGADKGKEASVSNLGGGKFSITQASVTVKDALNFDLHVGADADMTNKITVGISTMDTAQLGVKNLKVDGIDGSNATYAIDAIADAVAKVSAQRSALGAVQNRLEHTIANLDNVVENTTSAESAIRDTDMASEMVKYSNNNILAQAGQAMLAQANQSNQGVLSLLG